MADWDEPTVTTDYDVVFTISNEKFEDSAKMFDGSTSTNIPSGAYRINGAGANELQKYNGSSWVLQNLKLNTVTATTFTGNATTATTAAKITAANEATDNNCFPLFVTAATGNLAAKTNTTFTFNSYTGDVAIGGGLVLNAALTSANSNLFTIRNSYDSAAAFIDIDFSNTSNDVTIRHMRDTDTSGDRKSVWYKGDGTNSYTMSLDHDTGILETAGPINSNVKLNTKVIDIGVWNLTSGSKNVSHGLDVSKIHAVDVLIKEDDSIGNARYPLNTSDAAGVRGAFVISDTVIGLLAFSGGSFDSTDFNSTTAPANRGRITIQYTD
jgi:hypothetical protein